MARYVPAVAQRVKLKKLRRVAMVMHHAGRFERQDDARKAKQLKLQAQMLNTAFTFWKAGLAKMRHSMTGERYSGCATWYPTRLVDGAE